MPRKKKDDNKVIEFPQVVTEAKIVEPTEVIQPVEQAVQAAADGEKSPSKVLEILDRNRKLGLERMERAVDAYDERKVIGGEDEVALNEGMLRDVEAGVRSGFLALEALNNLVEMIRHDLIGMIQNVEGINVAYWKSDAHLQTLITLLKEKETITEEEMRETWDKIVPVQAEKAKKEQE